ncbi:MAG: LacI family DNA-binding transcriptional regulator [Nocardioidaceae bacterium]
MRPTQADVAEKARVSRALVSLVMRGAPNVSDKRRRRVLKAAEELGYRPNAYARSLASKKVQTIGVLVYDVTNPYFAGVYASLAKAAERVGYTLLVAPAIRSAAQESALVDTLLEHRVAGLALLSPVMRTKKLRQLCAAVPTVVVGRAVEIPGVDVVTTDERQAAELVIDRLVGLGHRDIVHISGGANRSARDRQVAYEAVMAQHGLSPRVVAGTFSTRGGRDAARTLLADGPLPTAVVAANDQIAFGAMGALRVAGVRVPEDVSVIGYDDSEFAGLDLVRLTSVRQANDRFGRAAITMLLDRIDHPGGPSVVRLLPAKLKERSTTGPAPTMAGLDDQA